MNEKDFKDFDNITNPTPKDFEELKNVYKSKVTVLEEENVGWREYVAKQAQAIEKAEAETKEASKRAKKAEDELLKKTSQDIRYGEHKEEENFSSMYQKESENLKKNR